MQDSPILSRVPTTEAAGIWHDSSRFILCSLNSRSRKSLLLTSLKPLCMASDYSAVFQLMPFPLLWRVMKWNNSAGRWKGKERFVSTDNLACTEYRSLPEFLRRQFCKVRTCCSFMAKYQFCLITMGRTPRRRTTRFLCGLLSNKIWILPETSSIWGSAELPMKQLR